MRLRDLKAKLLFFFARRLRSWASSVERYVSQSYSKEASVKGPIDDDSPHPSVKQIAPVRGDGPPKHWVDLVRLKAPELLSSPGTNLRAPRAELDQTSTSFAAEREDVGESDKKEKYVSEEAQPRVSRQNHARVPSVRQKLSKAKTFTRPRP